MTIVSALLLAGGRSEVVRLLRGQPTDEMWKSFDARASLFASFILIMAMVGAYRLRDSAGTGRAALRSTLFRRRR